MGFSVAALALSMMTFQLGLGLWIRDGVQTGSDSIYKDSDCEKQRNKRQLSSVSSTPYEYVYYTDLLIEGYSTTTAETYLTNAQFLPLSFTITTTLSVSVVQFNLTSVCNVTDDVKSCSCKPGFKWNITVCYMYPACNSSTSFCSCLVITGDDIPFCEEQITITAKNVTVLGAFILNRTFTTDMQNPASTTYKAMKYNITLALLNAYTKNSNPLEVSVIGFSPGSIIANYRMVVAGPVSSQQLTENNLASEQTIPNVISSQISTSGINSIQPESLTVKYWDTFQLSCLINDSVTGVKWSLVNGDLSQVIYGGGGNVQVSNVFLATSAISTLSIYMADQWWQGTYICQFFNDSVVHEATSQVNVTLLPTEILRNPIQKSISPADTTQPVLECCVAFDGETYNVTWVYDNITQIAQMGRRTDLACYTLVPPRPTNDTNYTCAFTNTAKQKKEISISIAVIKATDTFCSVNLNQGVTWNVTKAGVKAATTCPSGKTGNLTRACSISGVWLNVEDNCINQLLQSALENAQTLDQGLGNSQVVVPDIIQQLASANVSIITNTAEVLTIVNILQTISKVSVKANNSFGSNVITNFLSIASNLTDANYSAFWKQDTSPLASQVLQLVERFNMLLAADNGTIDIALPNIHLKGNYYLKGSVVDDYEKMFDLGLDVSMSIGKKSISSLLEHNNVTITSIVLKTIGNLLPSNASLNNSSLLNSIVQSTCIKLEDSGHFSSDIDMMFEMNNTDDKYTQHCVFWDFSAQNAGGSWSDVGCTTKVKHDKAHCNCNHLTSFAVLMSVNVVKLASIEEITLAGLGVSVLSLLICICIEGYVWKKVVRSNISYFRHFSLVNIALSLMAADACFLTAAFPSVTAYINICMAITFLNHFFYLSLFFWTFCQSLMLLHQLLFVFHHLRKRVYVSFAFFMGYFIPATIAGSTFLYFKPRGMYMNEDVCWLNPDTGALYTFAVPAGSVIVFNFITLIVVISKLSRPAVSDGSHPGDRETAKNIVKAIVVLTPVFGLTWSFGFALLSDLDHLSRQVFTYAFSAMNAFQGFFILLTCLTERKVREVLSNKTSSTTSSTTTMKSISEVPSKATSSM